MVEYFRGMFVGNIPRGQIENGLKFTVQRTFDTLDNCLTFQALHSGLVPLAGTVSMTLTGVGVMYLANAALDAPQAVKHVGVSCDWVYTLKGSWDPLTGTGGIWTNVPPQQT